MDTVLERLIEEKGLRKGFIAKHAGLHPSQLSRLLHSERDPRLSESAAAAIAERLGVPADAFMDGDQLKMAKTVEGNHQIAPSDSAGQQVPVKQDESDVPGHSGGTPPESALSAGKGHS